MDALVRAIERITGSAGLLIAWVVLPLILASCFEVFSRYVLNAPTIWAFELGYMAMGIHAMIGAALKPLVCTLLFTCALPAWADISRDEAAAAALRVASGRVLAVERTEVDRKPVWRVKILSARGEVRIVVVDDASGRVVR